MVDEACGHSLPEMFVAGVSQEHGIIRAMSGDLPYEHLMPGTRVRVLPNHACFTAAAYDAYRVVDGSAADKSAVVDTWPRVNGW